MRFNISPEQAVEILGTLPNLIYLFDIDIAQNIYTNHRILDYFGYSPEDIAHLGDDFYQKLFHPDDLPLIYKNLGKMKSLKPGETGSLEYRLRGKDGNWRWVIDIIKVFKSKPDGSAHIMLGIVSDIERDIDNRKKLSEAYNKLQLSLSTFDLGMWEWDLAKHTVVWDERMFNLHGFATKNEFTEKEIIDSFAKFLNAQELKDLKSQFKNSYLNSSDINASYSIKQTDGHDRHIRVRGRHVDLANEKNSMVLLGMKLKRS
ncbi:MAG: PAS domain-containing protein [Bdellovibrionia bacterium]